MTVLYLIFVFLFVMIVLLHFMRNKLNKMSHVNTAKSIFVRVILLFAQAHVLLNGLDMWNTQMIDRIKYYTVKEREITRSQLDHNRSENASTLACTNAQTYVCTYACMHRQTDTPKHNASCPTCRTGGGRITERQNI